MACDMVVALGRATGDGSTLFGHNSGRAAGQCQVVHRTVGRPFELGEKVRTQCLELPQARRTYTVLASQAPGVWGYDHGVSDQRVAVGRTTLRTRLRCQRPTLLGTDLVRLVLERAHSATHAVDVLIDLVDRHGQGGFPGCPTPGEADNAFLIADPHEAFAIETSGSHWVCQEVQEVRAASNANVVRQDWDRISHGLAGYAIAQGWWPADGSKLDFAGTLAEDPAGHDSGLRRWGRLTLLLEQQNGHIDPAFVRRLLGDHYEGLHDEVDPLAPASNPRPICRHAVAGAGTATTASCITLLSAEPDRLPVVWRAFGPPCVGLALPLLLDGDIPEPLTRGCPEPAGASFPWRVARLVEQLRQDREQWALAHEACARLQVRLEQEVAEFLAEAARLNQRGDSAALQRQAGLFMQHHLERAEEVLDGIARALTPVSVADG
jgi:secernin